MIRASRRRGLLEMIISLSRVVKPQPVSRLMTWKRAFSSGRPVNRNRIVNSSEMIQYSRIMSENRVSAM